MITEPRPRNSLTRENHLKRKITKVKIVHLCGKEIALLSVSYTYTDWGYWILCSDSLFDSDVAASHSFLLSSKRQTQGWCFDWYRELSWLTAVHLLLSSQVASCIKDAKSESPLLEVCWRLIGCLAMHYWNDIRLQQSTVSHGSTWLELVCISCAATESVRSDHHHFHLQPCTEPLPEREHLTTEAPKQEIKRYLCRPD